MQSQFLSEKAALQLDYNTKITNLQTTYENKVLELETAIAEKGSAISTLESEMNAAILSLENDYNTKINELVERVSGLEQVTYHTVTFDTGDGGSYIAPVLVEHGEKVRKPANPTRDGYTFVDWTYEGERWVFFGYVVTEDITLTADWDVTRYSATFKNDNGALLDYQYPVYYGDTLTYQGETPVKPNPVSGYVYTFTGWDKDLIVTGDMEFIAQYSSEPVPQVQWYHYSMTEPTASQKGIREYWAQSSGAYQFEAPASGTIYNMGTSYDFSDFTDDDPRYISYQYDEDHLSLSEYAYGAGMYSVDEDEFKNYRVTYSENGYSCSLYSEGSDFYLWRIDLPRIDYTRYPTVTMTLTAPNWNENNMMGPEADQLTYHTVYSGNKDKGKINLSLAPNGVYMEVIDMEYGSATAFTNTFTNSDIIHGLAPAYFYLQDKWDRPLNITNITLSTESQPIDVCSYAGDTSKLDVVNGDVALPGSVDYSIIFNEYGTNDNSLLVQGNANPGAAVIALPTINFDQYTSMGNVSFKFGVSNNNEHMYFGSGDSKVDLGTNAPDSQSNNNNGYVNWEMVITADGAYIHNVYENQNYSVTLTAGMRNGTESIVISGGNTSIYRRYFVTDFYWQA